MIRLAKINDLELILLIYDMARNFMAKTGNPTQWGKTWPPKELLIEDINNNRLYVLEDSEIYGVFALMQGSDKTYDIIEDGKWLNDKPYVTIHRIASSGKHSHILDEVVRYCFDTFMVDIRIDTHKDNITMNNALKRCGFDMCGIIYTHDGTKRIAYQREYKKGSIN